MTEEEWLTTARPTGMLLLLRAKVSDRKILLFNLACCRRIWNLLGEEDRKVVAQAERSEEDPTSIQELQRRLDPEQAAALAIVHLNDQTGSADLVSLLTTQTDIRLGLLGKEWGIGSLAHRAARLSGKPGPENARHEGQSLEEQGQTGLVRDIFGNPFRPIIFNPAWRTDTALTLARTMYESRDFGAMPILADALQDAGCTNDDILNHCRDANTTHVRGCWVVDCVLGKM